MPSRLVLDRTGKPCAAYGEQDIAWCKYVRERQLTEADAGGQGDAGTYLEGAHRDMPLFLPLVSVHIFIYGEQNIMSFIPERVGFAQERPKRPLIELNIVADRLQNGYLKFRG